MPIVLAGTTAFDVDAVAFDKDGTLIDLHATWGPLARSWIHGVTSAPDHSLDVGIMRRDLAECLGYDLAAGTLVADGVMAAGTLDQIRARTVDVLTGHGLDEQQLGSALTLGLEAVTSGGPVEPVPLTDLVALFGALHAAHVQCAIVTSDDRASAVDLAERFGLERLIAAIVGGDDPVRPKPSGDPLCAVADRLGIDTSRILMVGDSTTDQGAARAAGCPFVAVGRGGRATHDCDAVIDHVGEITVPGLP